MPPPQITGISPDFGSKAGGDLIHIVGNFFVLGATVTFGGELGIGIVYDPMTGFLSLSNMTL